MSRLSQSCAYLRVKPSDLTNDWIKTNLTDITITDKLLELRKENLKNMRLDVKLNKKDSNFGLSESRQIT